MSTQNGTPHAPVAEISDRLDWEVWYWQEPIEGAAPSPGRWVEIARCPDQQHAAMVANALAKVHDWRIEVRQTSVADMPPPSAGHRALREPKLFDISIRPATEGDIRGVAQLYHDWEAEAITLGLRADSEEDLTGKLRGLFLVACHQERVVGFATGEVRELEADEWIVCPAGGRYLNIEDLYVVPDLRSQGIGSVLVKRLTAAAKAESAEHVAVYSASQPSARIVRFYESLGLSVWFVQMFGPIPVPAAEVTEERRDEHRS